MKTGPYTSNSLLIKNMFLNLMGMLLPLLSGVIAIPFAIKGLGTEGFGILSIAWVILSYLNLLDFGLSRSTTKFTAENIKKENFDAVSKILWAALLITLTLGIIGGLILFFTSSKIIHLFLNISPEYINETKKIFCIFSYSLPLLLLSTSLRGILGGAQRFDLVNIVHIPVNIFNFIIPAMSLPFGISLSTIILLIIITRIMASCIYLFLCLNLFQITFYKFSIDFMILKSLLVFGGWVTVTGIISPILVYVDRFFIGSILSMSLLTYYAAPLEAITRLRILPIALMTTLFPEFSGISKERDGQRIRILFSKSIKIILLLSGALALVLFCYAGDILTLWLGQTFVERSIHIFRIFTLGILINSLSYIPFTLLQGIGRPDLPAKFHLIELPLYLILLWMMTIHFGIIGTAIAWLIRVFIDFLLMYIYNFKSLPILSAFFSEEKIWRPAFLLTAYGLTLFTFNIVQIDIRLKILILFFSTSIYIVIVWYFILSCVERDFISSIVKNRIFRRYFNH